MAHTKGTYSEVDKVTNHSTQKLLEIHVAAVVFVRAPEKRLDPSLANELFVNAHVMTHVDKLRKLYPAAAVYVVALKRLPEVDWQVRGKVSRYDIRNILATH